MDNPGALQAEELRPDWFLDGTVTAVAGLAWGITELLKTDLAPSACRWCDRNADGSDALNGVDAAVRDGLRWSDTDAAATASDVAAFALTPLAALGMNALAARHDRHLRSFPVDALLVAEATVLAGGLNQIVKFSVARQRPFVHFLPAAARSGKNNPDDNLSFYSGHATLAFALAVSSGTVASMRGYRWAPLVWAVGISAATATGYFRIAADRHYFTDVVVGAATGAAMGFAVPYLFHRPLPLGKLGSPLLAGAPVPGGVGLTLNWGW